MQCDGQNDHNLKTQLDGSSDGPARCSNRPNVPHPVRVTHTGAMAESDTVYLRMGCDWVEVVWDKSACESKLEGSVGVIVVLLLLLSACSDVRPYIRSDNVRLDKTTRVEIGMKGKF